MQAQTKAETKSRHLEIINQSNRTHLCNKKHLSSVKGHNDNEGEVQAVRLNLVFSSLSDEPFG